ncbi:MAG: hypothetical protein AAB263_07635, partial [Planctomycetota bacterium]
KEADFRNARGRILEEKLDGNLPVKGQVLRTTGFRWTLHDPKTMVAVISFVDYRVRGGWLVETLRVSESHAPLSFNSGCWGFGSESFQGWLNRYQIRINAKPKGK